MDQKQMNEAAALVVKVLIEGATHPDAPATMRASAIRTLKERRYLIEFAAADPDSSAEDREKARAYLNAYAA